MAEQFHILYARDKENPSNLFTRSGREIPDGNFIYYGKFANGAAATERWTPYLETVDGAIITKIKIGNGEVMNIEDLPIEVNYVGFESVQLYDLSLHELGTDNAYIHAVPKLNFHARTDEAVKAAHSAEEGLARSLCQINEVQNDSLRFLALLAQKQLDHAGDELNRLGYRVLPGGTYHDQDALSLEPLTKGDVLAHNNGVITSLKSYAEDIGSVITASKNTQATLLSICKGVDLVLLRTAMINGLTPYAKLHTSISQVDANGHLPANNLYEGHEAAPIHEILHRHLEGALEVHYPEVDGKLTSAFEGSRTRHETELGKVIALLEARDSPFLPLKEAARAVAAALQRGDVVAKWPETEQQIATLNPVEAPSE